MICPACDGELMQLGTLGNRTHYRCRSCGLDMSYPKEEADARTCTEHKTDPSE